VRAVQDARKQAGLEVADRIALSIEGDAAVVDALAHHRDYIMGETLASSWRLSADAYVATQEQGEAQWTIHVARDAEGG